MLKIVIPSYGRAGAVTALKNIPEEVQSKYYWIAVRPEEEKAYKEAYPKCNIKPLKGDVSGVTPTRQRINEQFEGKILVIDDDVKFITTHLDVDKLRHRGHKYCVRGNGKVTTLKEYDSFSEYICQMMENNPFGGLMSLGFKSDQRKFPNQWNRPIIWAVWFNLEKFDCKKFDYTQGPEFIEDVYMSIRWYDEGNDFPCVMGPYAIAKSHGTGDQSGGCNAVDNRSKSHNASAKWLEDNYPQYCWQKPSPKYHKTMGAPTNTVECKLQQKHRKVKSGDFTNKPDDEFQLPKNVNVCFVFYKIVENKFHLDPEFYDTEIVIDAKSEKEFEDKYLEMIDNKIIDEGPNVLPGRKYDMYVFKEVSRFKLEE